MVRKPRNPPWLPADYSYKDVVAVKAVAQGTATAEQQTRAVDWIINQAALTYDMPFRSDADGGDRDTTFALGKVFVGQQVVKLVNLPLALMETLRKKDETDGRNRNTEQPG